MGKSRRRAEVDRKICVSCGTCVKVCPVSVISIWKGCYAAVDGEKCVGCGKCAGVCPAGCIAVKEREERAGS